MKHAIIGYAYTSSVAVAARNENMLNADMTINQVMTRVNAQINDTMAFLGAEICNDSGIWGQWWWSQVQFELEKLGLVFLGSGHFAATFKTPAGHALKIGFKKDDSGAAYAAFCRANKMAHVSEILEMKRYSRCYMVMMPCYMDFKTELDAARDALDWRKYLELNAMYKAVHKSFYKWNDAPLGAGEVKECAVNSINITCAMLDMIKGFWLDERSNAELDKLLTQCLTIKKYFEDIGSFDIHEENIMLVKDEHTASGYRMIVTDPMSWTKSEEYAFDGENESE